MILIKKALTLDNNFVVLYEEGLDGGGYDHLPDFINAVKIGGRTSYENAVEWCAGFGVIGFDFLNKDMCNHMSFIDCHELAIDWLVKTSEHNNVSDRTSVYLADKISLIPNDVKWDLELANPPHCFTSEMKEHLEQTLSDSQKDDVIRILCDENYLIHIEFFENIRSHLLVGADVFISEVGDFEIFEKMALDAGLEIVGRYPAPTLGADSKPDAMILHFREPQ